MGGEVKGKQVEVVPGVSLTEIQLTGPSPCKCHSQKVPITHRNAYADRGPGCFKRLVAPMTICPKGREEWLRMPNCYSSALEGATRQGTHKDGKSFLAPFSKSWKPRLSKQLKQVRATGKAERMKTLGFRPSPQGFSPLLASGIYRDIFLDAFKSQKSIQEELNLGRR